MKAARALAENCKAFVEKHGLERVAFVTITLPDQVTIHKEAQRRFNSMRTHVLKPRYGDYIKASERQKSGRWHFHLLVPVGEDIRTGFDFAAYAAARKARSGASRMYWTRRYARSASPRLREEWRFWRQNARKYHFGRVEVMPIKSTAEGVARYIGKYIGKHMAARRPEDKGVRLVSYSKGARVWATRHTHNFSMTRFKIRKLAAMIGLRSVEDFRRSFGRHWAYVLREVLDLVALDPEDLPSIQHFETYLRHRAKQQEAGRPVLRTDEANRQACFLALCLESSRGWDGRGAWKPNTPGAWPYCPSTAAGNGEGSGEQGRASGAVRMNRPAIDAAKSAAAPGVPAR